MNTLKPGQYPIGSPESRAAARMLARQKDDQTNRLEVILSGSVCRVPGDPSKPTATPWITFDNGKVVRALILPEGMTPAEAHRIVASQESR
jgi:hypothetical protein